MKVVRDNLYLCSDCTAIACNGISGTGLEHSPFGERVLARLQQKQFANLVPDFDSETSIGLREFSSVPCSVCETKDAGYRARFAILGE